MAHVPQSNIRPNEDGRPFHLVYFATERPIDPFDPMDPAYMLWEDWREVYGAGPRSEAQALARGHVLFVTGGEGARCEYHAPDAEGVAFTPA